MTIDNLSFIQHLVPAFERQERRTDGWMFAAEVLDEVGVRRHWTASRGASVRKQLRKRATWHDSEWDIEFERGVDDCFRGLVRMHADEERRTHIA